ncbi:HepT-like ribonuclease domain-containing protein [Salinibacter ruber]|uniref:HepT-like ribonuclease domain-containing protein n=1 Tax=Salinibacter ruber TaxID=146919 RepID=UPI001619E94C|nr:DUF86 domain-containing protein [Salinibacter ruber]MBB4091107.1 uncharacterized protein with HEPN domain [Salinibacter ruber]
MSADERDELYLEHIRERIGRIEACAQEGREAFDASPILQDAVMRNFEVIGEAVKQLSPDLRDRYSSVEWRRVAGFRDVLIHNYMGVDLDEVWNVIERDLPRLKRTVTAMLDDMDG